jgi:hypothetical protein
MKVTSSAHITCLCGAIREPGSLLAEELPRDGPLCHCNSCRYVTGGLLFSGVTLHSKPSETSLQGCRSYATSDKITRWFCKTCGCHCFYYRTKEDLWRACSGAVEQSPESKQAGDPWPQDVLNATSHLYVRDTVDQQLAAWLRTLGGRQVPFYGEDNDEPALSEEQLLRPAQSAATRSDVLEARCHCGGVSLHIQRPTWDLAATKPYIPPEDKDKYVAGFCVCRSCRLAFGSSSLAPWIYVPEDKILGPDGTPVQFTPEGNNIAGAADYVNQSVVRSFCKTCGATVFYWRENRREVVDIATGLLRAPEGSVAKSWLWWRDELSCEEEATDQQLVDAYLGKS